MLQLSIFSSAPFVTKILRIFSNILKSNSQAAEVLPTVGRLIFFLFHVSRNLRTERERFRCDIENGGTAGHLQQVEEPLGFPSGGLVPGDGINPRRPGMDHAISEIRHRIGPSGAVSPQVVIGARIL